VVGACGFCDEPGVPLNMGNTLGKEIMWRT